MLTPVESIDIIEDNRLVLVHERGAVDTERRCVPIDPSRPACHGTAHGSALSGPCRPDHHEKTQMAGGEHLCEGGKILVPFDYDGVARDVFRLGHPPTPCIGAPSRQRCWKPQQRPSGAPRFRHYNRL